jgi:hypothetical protein
MPPLRDIDKKRLIDLDDEDALVSREINTNRGIEHLDEDLDLPMPRSYINEDDLIQNSVAAVNYVDQVELGYTYDNLDADKILNAVPENKINEELIEFARTGKMIIDSVEYYLQPPATHNGTKFVEAQRAKVAQVYAQNPELAQEMIKQDVQFAHGSQSVSLLRTIGLAQGLLPRDKIDGQILSGENHGLKGVVGKGSLINKKYVSIAYLGYDVAGRYSVIGAPIDKQEFQNADIILRSLVDKGVESFTEQDLDELFSNFPVLYLINNNAVKSKAINQDQHNPAVVKPRAGDIPERMVTDVNIEDIPIVLVPRSKIDVVKKLTANTTVKVFAIEDWPSYRYT